MSLIFLDILIVILDWLVMHMLQVKMGMYGYGMDHLGLMLERLLDLKDFKVLKVLVIKELKVFRVLADH